MPYLDWKQAPEVRSYLESAREKCKKLKERLPNSNREGLEPDVQDICQTLEAAYKESLKSHRTRYDESHIIFAGLYWFIIHKCNEYKELEIHDVISSIEKIISLALEAEKSGLHIPQDIQDGEFLKEGSFTGIEVYEFAIPRHHVAMVIASMFLCVIPQNPSRTKIERYPDCDYTDFFYCFTKEQCFEPQAAKLQIILHYFLKLHQQDLVERSPQQDLKADVITYRKIVREAMLDQIQWKECKSSLCEFEVCDTGRLEDQPSEFVQTDFANEYIGGGVLNSGRVQEEIRFCTAPELQASMVFMSVMLPNEAIQITGFEAYSDFNGYADSLSFAEYQHGATKRDSDGHIASFLTAIDAIPYYGRLGVTEQHKTENILRDINKALVGFHQPIKTNQPLASSMTSAEAQSHVKEDEQRTAECQQKRRHEEISDKRLKDLSQIYEFADSLTQSLMADVRNSLRLVIPDYFGFNVVHYDPVREEQGGRDHAPVRERGSGDSAMDTAEMHGAHTQGVSDSLLSPVSTAEQVLDVMETCTDSPCTLDQFADLLSTNILSQSLTQLVNSSNTHCLTPDSTINSVIESTMDIDTRRHLSSSSSYTDINQPPAMSPIYEDSMTFDLHTDTNTDQAGSPNYESGDGYLCDAVKTQIHQYSEGLSSDIISTAISEIRERRRLFIENNITSSQFHAARRLSDEVVGQIFNELQSEAENSISDAEKLSRIPGTERLEEFANGFVSEVIAKAKTTWTPPPVAQRGAYYSTGAPPQSKDYGRTRGLGRRSSAPIPHRIHSSLATHPRRGSEPAFMFRTHSPNNNPQLYPSSEHSRSHDPLRYEFDRNPRKANLTADYRSLDEHFQLEFSPLSPPLESQHRSNSSNSMLPSPRSTAASSEGSHTDLSQISSTEPMSVIQEAIQEASDYLMSNQQTTKLPTTQSQSSLTPAIEQTSSSSSQHTVAANEQCNQNDSPAVSPTLVLTIANNIHIQENQATVLQGATVRAPAVTNENSRRPRIQYNTMPYAGYNWQSGSVSPGASMLYINPPPPASHGAVTPPQSPLQHQYLKLYSEVMAENILHESLGNIRHMNRKKHVSGGTSLEQIKEEERKTPGHGCVASSSSTAAVKGAEVVEGPRLRPIATGNWGCGVFGGDPHLKSMLQWMAASKANAPKLRYYTFGDDRVANGKLDEIAKLLKDYTVGDLMRMILEYCAKRPNKPLFTFIKEKSIEVQEDRGGKCVVE